MLKPFRLPVVSLALLAIVGAAIPTFAQDDDTSANRWRINSIKVCRNYGGSVHPHIEVLGAFPVYSFFIPRPIWTVNGAVVEAQPIYDRGSLVGFRLLYAAPKLQSGAKNTIKLSLPDQTASRVFRYDKNKPPPGECYEFF